MQLDSIADHGFQRAEARAEREVLAGEKFDRRYAVKLYASLANVFYPMGRIERIVAKAREEYVEQETDDE